MATTLTRTSLALAALLTGLAPALGAQESGPDELSFAHIPQGSPLPPVARNLRQIAPAKVVVTRADTDASPARYVDQNRLGVGPANDSR